MARMNLLFSGSASIQCCILYVKLELSTLSRAYSIFLALLLYNIILQVKRRFPLEFVHEIPHHRHHRVFCFFFRLLIFRSLRFYRFIFLSVLHTGK